MEIIRALFSYVLLCSLYETNFAHPRHRDAWVVDDSGCLLPDNEAGFCTKLTTCETVTYLIGDRNFDSAEVRQILEEYACGVDENGGTKVCCPYTPLNIEDRTAALGDHPDHRNLRLLPKDCGCVRAWGFFTGNEANLFEFGWSVLLKYQKKDDPFVCGGSLINNKYILTSASCVRNKYKLIGARIGEQDIKTRQDCTWEYSAGNKIKNCGPPPQDFTVDESDITVHPEYDPRSLQNNIALIRLRQKVDTSVESVCPICLPIRKDEQLNVNAEYTAIGWGATESGLDSSVLLKTILEKVDKSACTETYPKVGVLSENQMCIRGHIDQNVCAEDYGGPLMGYYSKDHIFKTIQYGIVSFRPSVCKGGSLPTIYTNITSYVSWILDNIKP